jgi:hypothetical protein
VGGNVQRIASLGLVLCGVGLGLLLARSWADVPEAEAAKKVTWRCLVLGSGAGGGTLFLANPTSATHDFTTARLTPSGETPAEDDDIAPGGFGHFDVVQGFWIVRASGPLLVDATVNEAAGPRQAACFKGK